MIDGKDSSNLFTVLTNNTSALNVHRPRPDWLKVRLPSSEGYFSLKRLVRDHRLNTVCVEFDGVVPAEERPSWLRGRPAARDVDGADGSRSLASTAWSLRVKPDRRQSIVVMPIRRDRRGR